MDELCIFPFAAACLQGKGLREEEEQDLVRSLGHDDDGADVHAGQGDIGGRGLLHRVVGRVDGWSRRNLVHKLHANVQRNV